MHNHAVINYFFRHWLNFYFDVSSESFTLTDIESWWVASHLKCLESPNTFRHTCHWIFGYTLKTNRWDLEYRLGLFIRHFILFYGAYVVVWSQIHCCAWICIRGIGRCWQSNKLSTLVMGSFGANSSKSGRWRQLRNWHECFSNMHKVKGQRILFLLSESNSCGSVISKEIETIDHLLPISQLNYEFAKVNLETWNFIEISRDGILVLSYEIYGDCICFEGLL